MTGADPVAVKVPRMRDRGNEAEKVRFTSLILLPYLRNPHRDVPPIKVTLLVFWPAPDMGSVDENSQVIRTKGFARWRPHVFSGLT